MQAIPTKLGNIRFRSRLEAKWSLFFASLGIAWEYEPEDFSFPDRGYRPDFWLRTCECWAEIKPPGTPLDHQLAAGIQEQSGSPLLWIAGEPRQGGYQVSLCDFGTVEELPGFTFALTKRASLILHGERDGERCRVGLPPSWVSYETAWSEALDAAALVAAYQRAMAWKFGEV